ncbi:MAG: UDP-N-acetylmuramoyl-tripeptide--D-alanyl-D-alanine ligase [Acidimicrobiales bacterium]|nr:UDP-N-acetylmuramoyl-tripeptide--D-alanyl-D-alanine ligase [Acidimicrobiales bacterium]
MSSSAIAEATGGEVFGREVVVSGAGIDSRTIEPDQLFVPVVAERDGHDFIGAAVAAGAGAYLSAGPIEAGTAIVVDDTRRALTALGSAARERLAGPVVGVTGSVGKTSLKDIMRAVGASTWATHASVRSLNNELGVPLTLLNAPDATELTVVEMGARGVGHVAELCAVARPTVGIVTVVAGAHLEQFGDLDGVALAKGELIEALPGDGLAVLNADDARVSAMASRGPARALTFGTTGGEVRASEIALDDDLRPRFTLHSPWGGAAVRLSVAGEHQVLNALGAAAAALGLGATVDAVVDGLARAELSPGRMHVSSLADGTRIIDDAYNANPTSTEAALRALAGTRSEVRVAVLGTMAELGPEAEGLHAQTAELAASFGIIVVAVAEERYGSGAIHVDGPEAAVREVAGRSGPGTAVLVKASRSAGLERVVAGLVGR